MKNALIGIVIGGLVVGLVGVIAWSALSNKPASILVDTIGMSPTPSAFPVQNNTATPVASPTPTPQTTGMIAGKLCYPSSFLPKGQIEAKNTATNTVTTQPYPGSQNGGKSTYALELTPGTYVLRYKAQVDANNASYGYHTSVCPTGIETTCAATNARTNIQIQVKAGTTASDVNLCDFYYDQTAPPAF